MGTQDGPYPGGYIQHMAMRHVAHTSPNLGLTTDDDTVFSTKDGIYEGEAPGGADGPPIGLDDGASDREALDGTPHTYNCAEGHVQTCATTKEQKQQHIIQQCGALKENSR